MTADRNVSAPSNTPGSIPGSSYLEDLLDEVKALWRYAIVPLSGVAGSANTITANADVPLLLRERGNGFTLVPTLANTGATTLNINTQGARNLLNRDGTALANGRLQAGRMEIVIDAGTEYRLQVDKPAITAAPREALFAYQTPVNVAGVNLPTGWADYPLNTEVFNDISGLTFNTSTGAIGFPAGDFEIEATVFGGDNRFQVFLWDVTDAAPHTAGFARLNGFTWSVSHVLGRVSLAVAKTKKIRLYSNSTTTTGAALNTTSPVSVPEQYGWCKIRTWS